MINAMRAGLAGGQIIPYLGAGVVRLDGGDRLPDSPDTLVGQLIANVSVPHKLRRNLTGAAQFIENFKHRKTVTSAMTKAFQPPQEPNSLHHYLAALPSLRLLVHAWYDDLPQKAFAGRVDWSVVQGVSQAEHFGSWSHSFRAGAAPAVEQAPLDECGTVLYQPWGSISPAANFLVSDSDFVEVLTEIDIQTPIPDIVQSLRTGRSFLFLGCRFTTQLDRIFAHQIMKRSSDRHWAILPETPTRNELRFLEQHGIERIAMPLDAFVAVLTGAPVAREQALAG